jgi:hypothetical protein
MTLTTDMAAIREFVQRFDHVQDVQFSTVPYPLDSHEGVAYLLIVASINQDTAAERVRDLVRGIHDRLGSRLFRWHTFPGEQQRRIVESYRSDAKRGTSTYPDTTWKLWPILPTILSSATTFIEKAANHGGLIVRGRAQGDAVTAVERIATNVYYMGARPGGARKKAWMFMRWMVRLAPDIGVWNPPLKPADLRVPLDTNTGKAFLELTMLPSIGTRMEEEGIVFSYNGTLIESTAENVEAITSIARWFFPDDPARVDYALFCYGRRFNRGEDAHRCWRIVGCTSCPIRDLIHCKGHA